MKSLIDEELERLSKRIEQVNLRVTIMGNQIDYILKRLNEKQKELTE